MIKRNVKYIIHACKEREWYVSEYLVPSMVKQGIAKRDIRVWMDADGIGNLQSFVNCCKWIAENQSADEAIWHLQDDVVISDRFGEVTAQGYDGLVAGFCNNIFDGERTNYIGKTLTSGMWFSFQCVLIPNRIASGFAEWYENKEIQNGECVDGLFRKYILSHTNAPVTNLMPNIVDHVDYLIGGSEHNDRRIAYWRDKALDEAVKKVNEFLEMKD